MENTQMMDLISPEVLAEKLDINTATLATWRHTGRHNLPFIKVGRKVMYRVKDVEHWLNSRTMQHTHEQLSHPRL